MESGKITPETSKMIGGLMKLGCGSLDNIWEFVTCDDCQLSYDGYECKKFRQCVVNVRLGIVAATEAI
jgi:hypothetical protein